MKYDHDVGECYREIVKVWSGNN